jgi:hypothetical protein
VPCERLKNAADPDAVVAKAKESSFAISKAELLRSQSPLSLERSGDDLDHAAREIMRGAGATANLRVNTNCLVLAG